MDLIISVPEHVYFGMVWCDAVHCGRIYRIRKSNQ